jgi:hypothetical protein
VRRYTLKSLRDQISFVLQDTLLFRTTIWDNIAYGNPSATPQEILRAAKLAWIPTEGASANTPPEIPPDMGRCPGTRLALAVLKHTPTTRRSDQQSSARASNRWAPGGTGVQISRVPVEGLVRGDVV